MPMFFDRSGNAYQIDDENLVKRKSKLTLTNTAGEEFEIEANKGYEYRLTPDEHRRKFEDLKGQVAQLGKYLGHCQVIDPVGPAVTGVEHNLSATLTKIMEGCPNIDPVRLGSVLGTLVQKEFGGLHHGVSCPNIDPANIGSVVGNVHRRVELDVATMLRHLLDSCPNIDPPRIGSIMGSIVERELFSGNRR